MRELSTGFPFSVLPVHRYAYGRKHVVSRLLRAKTSGYLPSLTASLELVSSAFVARCLFQANAFTWRSSQLFLSRRRRRGRQRYYFFCGNSRSATWIWFLGGDKNARTLANIPTALFVELDVVLNRWKDVFCVTAYSLCFSGPMVAVFQSFTKYLFFCDIRTPARTLIVVGKKELHCNFRRRGRQARRPSVCGYAVNL